jgi:hypothetical protein
LILIQLAGRVVALAKEPTLLDHAVEFSVPVSDTPVPVLLTGLQPGTWRITTAGSADQLATVDPGRNTLHFNSPGGRHRVAPQ